MTLYRYLITSYLQIFLFCVAALLGMLFSTRLQEIAQFAAYGADQETLYLFILYQLPYVIPIVVPIACLIASMLLSQRLSDSNELTALRACGYGLNRLIAPLMITASFIAILNFVMISEVATRSHLSCRSLQEKFKQINPLIILQNKKLASVHGICAESLGTSVTGERVSDLLIAYWSPQSEAIHLLTSKEMVAQPPELVSKQVSAITPLTPKNPVKEKATYLIENFDESITTASNFSKFIKRKNWRIHADYLPLAQLLTAIRELDAQDDHATHKKYSNQFKSDIARRASIALSAITFTLMGIAFGIQIGREKSKKSIFKIILLAAFYLICFFTARHFEKNLPIAITLYLFPQLLLQYLSIRCLSRISRGVLS